MIFKLTPNIAQMVEIIKAGLKSGKSEIVLPRANTEMVRKSFEIARLCCPSCFNLGNEYSYTSGIDTKIVLMPEYIKMENLSYQRQKEKLDNAAAEIIFKSGITSRDSSYIKAIKLKEYFCSLVKYDEKARDSSNKKKYAYAYSAYGPIVFKKGVCQGISAAFAYLLEMCGVECAMIRGESSWNGEMQRGHAWNVAMLSNGGRTLPYHIDITPDLGEIGGVQTYDYFCLPDAQISVDHSWDRELVMPSRDFSLLFFSQLSSRNATSEMKLKEIILDKIHKTYTSGTVYFKFSYFAERNLNNPAAIGAHIKSVAAAALGWDEFKITFSINAAMKTMILTIER